MTRLLPLLFLAVSAFAQTSLVIRVMDNGQESVARVSGQAAIQGLDILKQWMATQQICTPVAEVPAERDGDGNVTKPGTPAGQNCAPKFANPAELVKSLTLDTAQQLAPQYPSAALKADVEEAKAKAAIVEAKRKALFDAARAEKP